MKLERPICFLDVEATGIDPVKDKILELGVVVLLPNGDRTKWVQRFNPGMLIHPAATEVHGISDADVKDCPPFSDWAVRVHRGLQGKDLAGYNPWRLDLPMLDEEFRRCGLRIDLTGVLVIDCYGIFAKKEGRKLEDAVLKFCHREHAGAHGALADAEATLDVFLGQLVAYPDLDGGHPSTVAAFSQLNEHELVDLAGKLYRDKDGDCCYAFGKSKDVKVRDDPGFADWMLKKDFPASTVEAIHAEFNRIWPRVEGVGG